MVWKILCCVLIGYAVGIINPSYIISKLHGFDIRKKGSGNAGASNVVIVLGNKIGAICAVFDIAKAAFVVWFCPWLFPDVSLLATPRCKKPHDGMAEALLMAEYARRKL